MKKSYLFILLLFSTFSFAQSYSILNSASGEYMAFQPIYEDTELYGYVELRQMNVDENFNNTIKYIVLDKNFNTICSGDLIEKMVGRKEYKIITDIDFFNGFIRFSFQENSKYGLPENAYFKTFQVLDLKKNRITTKGIYNPDIKDIDKKFFKLDRRSYFSYPLGKTGILINEFNYTDFKVTARNRFYVVDENNKTKWEYKSERTLKKYGLKYDVINYDENYIVLQGIFYTENKKATPHILILDAKTGKELFYLPNIETQTLLREYTYLKDGIVYTGGRYFEKDKKEEYRTDESLGIFQTKIDIAKKAVIQDKYIDYSQFPDININKFGKVRGEGFLQFQRRGLNPDGTFLVLAESYWQKHSYRAYTQLYTFTMDKYFNPIKTMEYEVKRTKGYKYDFSQLLPNNTGRAYFFFDKNDEKDLELNILNYYFKSKKEVIQKMPISNDDSTINVFPAKTGYVAIAEYFKNPKKTGKYMEIRLEKLNYERE